jgi:hypothetical protein
MNYTLFNADGRPVMTFNGSAADAALQTLTVKPGHCDLYGDYLDSVADEVKPRPVAGLSSVYAVAVGQTLNLPAPNGTGGSVEVRFDGIPSHYGYTPGALELQFELAGVYLVKYESWPYLPFDFVVEVSDA